MLRPIVLPPASEAPRFAASMMPASAAGANDVPVRVGGKTLRPGGDTARAARARRRSSGRADRRTRSARSRRTRSCRRCVRAWKACIGSRYSARMRSGRASSLVEELLVLVGEWLARAVARCHGFWRTVAKVDESARDVGPDELYAHPVTDIEALESADDPAFGRRAGDAHPRSLLRCAGHDGIEPRADARGEEQRRRRLHDLPLHLRRVVLLVGAMARERRELVVGVRRRLPASAAFSRR